MFAPGAAALCTDFGITDSTIATLTVTIYVLGFAIGPLFISPLSEIYGRLIIYHVGNAVYLAFTIGCALSTNTAMFMVFRLLCGLAAASPMSIGGGTIADLHRQEEGGKAMALFGLGPLLGPVSLSRALSVPTYLDILADTQSVHWPCDRGFRHGRSQLEMDFLAHSHHGKSEQSSRLFGHFFANKFVPRPVSSPCLLSFLCARLTNPSYSRIRLPDFGRQQGTTDSGLEPSTTISVPVSF